MAMNDTIRSIIDRRSIRAYTGEALTGEQLNALKQCALASPTALNKQSWHFSFVTDRTVIDAADKATFDALAASGDTATVERMRSRGGSIFYGAPLVVFISGDASSRWSGVDAGIAAENLALAAHSMGLGSVIIGLCAMAFEGEAREPLEAALRFPEGHRFVIAVAVGHPAAGKGAHPIHDGRLCDI